MRPESIWNTQRTVPDFPILRCIEELWITPANFILEYASTAALEEQAQDCAKRLQTVRRLFIVYQKKA